MKRKVVSLLICILLLTACGGNSYETIDSNVAMDLIKNDAIVIDVREADEFATGHIENAINIPFSNISSIDYDKETIIIVYCASGMRSATAAKSLIEAGYTNVYNLDGGLINWGGELVEE